MNPSYSVLCTRQGCARPALYKIAARWSDGVTEELKPNKGMESTGLDTLLGAESRDSFAS